MSTVRRSRLMRPSVGFCVILTRRTVPQFLDSSPFRRTQTVFPVEARLTFAHAESLYYWMEVGVTVTYAELGSDMRQVTGRSSLTLGDNPFARYLDDSMLLETVCRAVREITDSVIRVAVCDAAGRRARVVDEQVLHDLPAAARALASFGSAGVSMNGGPLSKLGGLWNGRTRTLEASRPDIGASFTVKLEEDGSARVSRRPQDVVYGPRPGYPSGLRHRVPRTEDVVTVIPAPGKFC